MCGCQSPSGGSIKASSLPHYQPFSIFHSCVLPFLGSWQVWLPRELTLNTPPTPAHPEACRPLWVCKQLCGALCQSSPG